MGKQLNARTIKWKFGLTWGDRVKNLFFILTTLGIGDMLLSLPMRKNWNLHWTIGFGM